MAQGVRQPRRRAGQLQHQHSDNSHQPGKDEASDLIFSVFGSRDALEISQDRNVDLQVTALVAAITKQSIQSWYGLITDDQEFVEAVRSMIQAMLQQVYRRSQTMDIRALVLDEIPALIDDHLQAIEYATRYAKDAFHTLRPHPALKSEADALAWSQTLVAKILPLLLDSRDVDNPALRVLLSEVLSEIVLYRGLLVKTCEPSFIWDNIVRAMPKEHQSSNTTLPLVWHWIVRGLTFCWYVVVQPVRKEHVNTIFSARIWSLLSTVLQLQQRLPWIYGMGAVLQRTLLGATVLSYELDRLISDLVQGWLVRSEVVANLLQQARYSLFPNQPPAPPLGADMEQCSQAIVKAIPVWAGMSYFGASDVEQRQEDVKRSLAALSDASVNQALMIAIVELIIAKLFPELAE